MKIKIIDLLNKIANGEEVPKKIRIGKMIFYRTDRTAIEMLYRELDTDEYYTDYTNIELDTEIDEIIEEPKKIEKIDISTFPNHNNSLKKTAIKLNEIIDYINSKEDK